MKRILLLAALLFLSPLSLMAETMEGATEDASIAADCRQNGTDIGLKDADLDEYVAECVAANSDAAGMEKEEKPE